MTVKEGVNGLLLETSTAEVSHYSFVATVYVSTTSQSIPFKKWSSVIIDRQFTWPPFPGKSVLDSFLLSENAHFLVNKVRSIECKPMNTVKLQSTKFARHEVYKLISNESFHTEERKDM